MSPMNRRKSFSGHSASVLSCHTSPAALRTNCDFFFLAAPPLSMAIVRAAADMGFDDRAASIFAVARFARA